MNKKAIIAVLTFVILVIVIIFSVRNSSKNQINIGLISILSGDYASVGENFRNGVILANEEYNKAHPDSPISLFVEDDGFSGGRGVSAYEKLTTVNKINGLINLSTPTIDSIYTKVVADGLPVMQGGEQGSKPSNDNVFGLFPDSIESQYQFGVYMRNKGVKEMAVVYTNLDALVRFVEAFKEGFQGTTTDFVISPDEKDFKTHALKVANSKNQNITFFIYPEQGAQFIKEYTKVAQTKAQLAFDTSLQTGFADYKRILGDTNVLNGALVGTSVLETDEAFKNSYKERFGTEYGFLADMGYDAFNILVSSYSSDNQEWVENIKKVSHGGVSGKIEFTETGNRKPEAKMMIVEKGEIVDIKQ